MRGHEMIDDQKLAQVQAAMAGTAPEKEGFDLDTMTHDELRELRDEIDRRLPEDSLDSLNLEKELVGQYRVVKRLQADVITNDDFAPNQRSQVAGQVASTLQQLVKLQEDLKREQTLKLMESVLVDMIKSMPEDFKTNFFTEYKQRASKVGLL